MSTATKSTLLDAVNKPIKGAISRLFGRPFQLTLGKRVLTFNNPADFEFALGGRVSVSLIKVVELLHRPAASLRRETVAIKLIEQKLQQVLQQCRSKPEHIGALLHDVGVRAFSTDYRWRAIFESLAEGGAELNPYRHVAVAKYLQYLCARRDALGIVFYHKTGKALEEEIVVDAPREEATTRDEEHTMEPEQLHGFRSLPHGKSVVVSLSSRSEFRLYLADQGMSVRLADGVSLIDPQGREHRLAMRQNSVGRAIGNDVIVEGNNAAVSRKHLIIEPLSDNRVRLTDLSAGGTFVPADLDLEEQASAVAA